jgi:peptide deformylase
MKALQLTQFGNPILRQRARQLSASEINSPKIQSLIQNMRSSLTEVKLGVGLAAPQVGENVALAVVVVQPSEHRPKVEPFEVVLINPVITETSGRRKQLWEGCISSGRGKAGLFAKVPRYNKIKVKFIDGKGKHHHIWFNGLRAHIIQHETDHLSGILFVDRVRDTTSYMTYSEYLKQVKKEK